MKKTIYLLLVLTLSLLWAPVQAKADNGFFADEDVTLSKSIDTTTFVAGNNIDVTSKIDGASFIAGNNLSISSSQDYIFAAGNSLKVRNANTKDAFLAGSLIEVENSKIRDLYAMGATVKVFSDISRNAYLAGDEVIINSTISGDVKIAADKITIGENAIIEGTLLYPEGDSIELDIDSSAVIGSKETYQVEDAGVQVTIVTTIKERILSFLSILIIGLILLALNKKMFTRIEEMPKEASELFKNIGIGLATLILLPVAAILLLITVIGIPLSIISLLLYGIFIYLSAIPASYYIGKWILKDKIKNSYLVLIISLAAIYVLKIVPVIGGIVSFITLLLGLGMFIRLMINQEK